MCAGWQHRLSAAAAAAAGTFVLLLGVVGILVVRVFVLVVRVLLLADAAGLRQSLHEVLDRLEKTEFEAAHASYEDLFRYLLLPAVVLLALEALLGATLLRRFP